LPARVLQTPFLPLSSPDLHNVTEPINVDDLRFLLSIAETGSTLSASKVLKVSQSTVSRRIAALEADLCIQLFHKRRTGYVLTEAGAALIAPAQAVAQAVDAFSSAVGSLTREISGTVRFTTNEVLSNLLLTDLTMRLKQVHPGVRLEVDTSNLLRDLANGEADVALRAAPAPTEPGLVGLKLVEDYWSSLLLARLCRTQWRAEEPGGIAGPRARRHRHSCAGPPDC
jgi:DNA-binding transcriptional LysR family regulator